MNWHAWALKGFQKPKLAALQQTSTVLSRQLTRGKQNYGNRLPYFCSKVFFSVPHFESRIQLTGFAEHIAAENGFSSHSTCTNKILFGHYDEYAATESFTKLAAQEVLPMGKQHLLCFLLIFAMSVHTAAGKICNSHTNTPSLKQMPSCSTTKYLQVCKFSLSCTLENPLITMQKQCTFCAGQLRNGECCSFP